MDEQERVVDPVGTAGARDENPVTAAKPQSSGAAALAAANAGPIKEGARRWVLIVGGVMALGWLLVIIGVAGGGPDATGTGAVLMIPAAIYWRIKTGRQVGAGAAGWIKGRVDQRTHEKVVGSHFNQAVDNATGLPGMSTHDGIERAGMKMGGFFLKRSLLWTMGAFYCFVRPIKAVVGELRAMQDSRSAT